MEYWLNKLKDNENDVEALFQLANNNDINQKKYIENGLEFDPNNILLKTCNLKYTNKYLNDILNSLDNINENDLGYVYCELGKYYKYIDNIKSKNYLIKSTKCGYLISYIYLYTWFNININEYKNDILEFIKHDELNININYNLGLYYQFIEKDYNKMKKYYLLVVDNGNAMNNLGYYYKFVEKNYNEMRKYYLKAIKHNNSNAMNNLGEYYYIIKNYNEMKKYYLMAIEHGNNSNTMNNLGYYYRFVEKNYDEMKKYYLMAIEYGNNQAMNNLGAYYYNIEKNYNEMMIYYVKALEYNNIEALYNLGYYYQNIKKDNNKMKKYYLMALLNKYNNNNNIYSDIPSYIFINAIINYNYEYKGYDNRLKNICDKVIQFNNLQTIETNECYICYEINELKQFNFNLLCKSCFVKTIKF
jgi:TPR repeat protein